MSPVVSGSQADIVRLTKVAGEAAQQGRWDEVIRCYHERGMLLASTPDVTLPTGELLRMDAEVRDRIHTAQAVLKDLLAEAQMTKQRVQGLRQRFGVPLSGPKAVSLEA